MKITKTMLAPSREDAVRMTRQEKISMIVLAYAATILDDLQKEIAPRLNMVEDGPERLKELSEKTDALLHELRLTIPVNQRMNLQNTANDFEIRLTPKLTPSQTSVVMQKEEFRELVEFARAACKECAFDNEECQKCKLFQLLTVLLPLDDYEDSFLCPYVLKEWGN